MSEQGRNLSCPTVDDALAFAIGQEEEAVRFYEVLAGTAANEASRAMLLELRAEEERHRELLAGLRSGRLVLLKAIEIPDLSLTDYAVEEPLGPESPLQDVLISAAHKEGRAAALYECLAEKVSSPEDRNLLLVLAEQEKLHKLRLEQDYESHVLAED